jgi:four helix bundle protein
MEENIIEVKSADFAVRIINLTRYLKKLKVETNLTTQLQRSGTSIGANVHEATAAISEDEFSAKMSISLKEARETKYWLKVLVDTKTLSQLEYNSISRDCIELEKILFSIVRTTRSRKKKWK